MMGKLPTTREAIAHLREMERFWDVALDAFKRYAEKRKRRFANRFFVARPPEFSFKVFCGEMAEWD